MSTIALTGHALSWAELTRALQGPVRVALTTGAKRRMARSRAVVESVCAAEHPVYGINTGFGIFARTKIAADHLAELQRNLVVSHAAGVGALLPDVVVRTMMLLKLHGLALGYSGVRPALATQMARWLNAECLPEIPAQGSVGASGDLAPLAHLTLALLGEGRVRRAGRSFAAAQAIRRHRLPRLRLAAKEGLALLNGTQAMVAVGLLAVETARRVLDHADLAGALSIEGLLGSVVPFDARLHAVRAHPGAVATARRIRALVAGSRIVASHRQCGRVQDPYALRCIPAVHGTVRDALTATQAILLREANSVTDNPVVFATDDTILSGGNFHGAPLALALDHLAIAMTTLASISERRIEQLINPKAGELPVLGLTPHPGLHSGFMVAHTTAASLVSENKTLAHPASVDTIPTWAGQEDHVSMGMWGARKLLTIVENTLQVVAIELLAACQAIDLHPTRHTAGKGTERAYRLLRRRVRKLTNDRIMAPDLTAAADLIRGGSLLRIVLAHNSY